MFAFLYDWIEKKQHQIDYPHTIPSNSNDILDIYWYDDDENNAMLLFVDHHHHFFSLET